MGRKKEKEDEFYVEVIMAAKVVARDPDSDDGSTKKRKKGSKKQPEASPTWTPKEYCVKWHGYPDSENSWEPAENLKSCTRLLASFWAVVGVDDDDRDYYIDDIVEPPASWIAMEKKRFAKEQEEAKRAKEGAGSKKRKRGSKKEKEKIKESEEPEPPKPSTSSVKSERRKKIIIESDPESNSDSDSDTPLSKKKRRKIEKSSEARVTEGKAFESSKPQAVEIGSKVPKGQKRKRPEEEASTVDRSSRIPVTEPTSPNSLFSDVENSQSNDAIPTPQLPQRIPPPLPLPARISSATAVPSLPTRVKAPPNPHTKLATMPQEAGPSSIGISTKQRIAQGALAHTLPKNVNSAIPKPKHVPTSPVRTGSSSIMTTGFRKTAQISPVFIHREPTLASLNAPPASPTLPNSMLDVPVTHSPTSLERPGHSFGGNDYRPSYETQQQVDDFLQSVMPPQMAGPLEAISEISAEPRPPPPLPSRVPPLPTRILKTYKWEGILSIATSMDSTDAQLRFKVILEDEQDVKQTALRFSILLNSLSELPVQRSYHVHDLTSVIPSCKTPNQFAKVALQTPEEKKPWVTFLRYLAKSKKVLLIPLRLDGNVVAQLLLVPSKLALPSPFNIPSSMRMLPECMVASILTWTLTIKEISTESRLPPLPILPDTTSSKYEETSIKRVQQGKERQSGRSLKNRPMFHEAIRILDFPRKIYDYLKQTNRPWAICPPHNSGNPKFLLEVQLMRSILSRIKEEAILSQREDPTIKPPILREAPTPESAQMLFVHVGALRHLNKFAWLRERILSPDYVRFYTFGSHPSVHQNFWGVQEIYPCGGVVTFLPSSFMHRPYEMMQIIKKINEHPFWTAYILPSVLGMIAQKSGIGTTLDHNEHSLHSYILKAIEDGQIALIEAPPDNRFCGELNSDPRHRWFQNYLSGLPPSEEEALSLAHSAFNSVSANVPKDKLAAKMELEVAEDMARMQRQPVFMSDYRRYVVLTGTMVTRQDSLEWVMPTEFKFKDTFLQD